MVVVYNVNIINGIDIFAWDDASGSFINKSSWILHSKSIDLSGCGQTEIKSFIIGANSLEVIASDLVDLIDLITDVWNKPSSTVIL